MAQKSKSNPNFSRQRKAAAKARVEKKWVIAIRNYTKALAHEDVPLDQQIELLKGRADCYAQSGERDSQIADLSELNELYEEAQKNSALELDERSANLAIVNQINQALADRTDLDLVIDLVGDRISEYFKVESVGIVIYEHDKNLLITEYYKDQGKRIEIEPIAFGEGITSKVVKSEKPMVFGTREEARKMGAINLDRIKAESFAGVPIFAGPEVIGVLSLLAAEKHAFQAEDIASLSAIAANLGWALKNARLLDETKQRNAELAVINSVQGALAEELDIGQIYEIVGEKLREIFDVGAIQINVYDLEADSNAYVYSFEDGKRLENISIPINAMHRYFLGEGTQLFNSGLSEIFEKFGVEAPQEGRLPMSAVSMQLEQRDKKVLSILLSDMDQEYAFTEADAGLLETLTNSMSVALETARLFDESSQRNAELAVINSVQAALAEELDIDSIYEIVGEKIREIFDVGAIQINVYDIEANTNSYVYAFEDGARLPFLTVPINEMHRTQIKDGKPVLVNRNFDAYAKQFGAKAPHGELPKSALWIPLPKRGKQATAVVLLDTENEGAFSDSDVRLLETIANSMAVALENARLFDESQQRLAELEIVNTAQDALASKLDIKAIYREVGEKLCDIFQAQAVVIESYDFEKGKIIWEYAFEKGEELIVDPLDFSYFTREFALRGKTLLLNKDVDKFIDENNMRIPAGEAPKSWLATPLKKEGKVTGSIHLSDMDHEHAFSQSDVQLLETLAKSTSIALENARLFDELQSSNDEISAALERQNATGEILEVIARSPGDLFSILNVIAETAAKLLDLNDVMIPIVKGDEIELAAHFGELPFLKAGTRLDLDRSTVTGRSIIEKKTIQAIHNQTGQKSEYPSGDKVAKKYGYSLTLSTPLLREGKAIGAIAVLRIEPTPFDDQQVDLLKSFANQAVIAIDNERLFNESNRLLAETNRLLEETTQRNAELAVINSIQQALVSQLDIDGIYNAVGDQIKDIFDAQVILIASFDRAYENVTLSYFYEKGEKFDLPPMPLSVFNRRLIKGRKTIVINEHMEEESKRLGMVVPAGEHAKSSVFVPIILGEEVTGFVSLQNVDRENAFPESDVRLLSTITNSMAVALENARLFDETNKRNAELDIINSVGEAMAQQLDVKTVTKIVGDKVQNIFSADKVIIGLINEDEEKVSLPYYYDRGEYYEPDDIAISGLGQIVAESRKPLVFGTHEEMKRAGGISIDVGKQSVAKSESWMGVPIIAANQVIGVVSVQSYKTNAFAENDVQLLSTLATNMGVAIRNAQLYQKATQRAEEMAALAEVGEEISQELDVHTLLEQIAARALKLLDGSDAVIRIIEEDGKMPAIVDIGERAQKITDLQSTQTIGEGINGFVARSGIAEIVNSLADDPRALPVPGLTLEELGYSMFVPLISKEKVTGVMAIHRSGEDKEPFNEDDLKFVVSLARQAAIAMGNAKLFEEVQRQKEYFEGLLLNNPVAVLTIDMDGTVVSWNPAAEELFQYTEQEAIGRNVDDLVAKHPDLREEARSYTGQASALAKVSLKTKRTRKDGSLVDVEVLGLPVTVAGDQLGFITIYHDITELEAARRTAEEANLTKSAFLANMSHELRTPLNAIIGFTRIVKRKGERILPEKQTGNLDKVLVSAEHLLGLINTILDIAKIEAGRMDVRLTNFEIGSVVDLCVTTTQSLIKRDKVKLAAQVPQGISKVYSDEEKIKQILLNLLSNAAKFTEEGKISVEVEERSGQIHVAVKDSGIGISEEGLGQIFEEFQQVDNSTTREYGGTGLGLSISRRLAQLLGGDITVASGEGKGSEFTLSFPVQYDSRGSEERIGESSQSKSPLVEIDESKPIVLAIDDNPDVVSILRENLEDAGYQVVGASNGDEGVRKAIELKPHAITLDIMMPNKDGWQVLYELKHDARTKDIPVIILSIVDKKALGFRLGASDYLVKPLNEKAVLESLNSLIQTNGGKAAKKILVVDDDQAVIDMVRQLLEGENFSIEEAADGTKALAKLKTFSPDVILLDLLMPKMDGFEFLEKFHKKKRQREIPVIILTAKSLTNAEMKKLGQHVSEIIQKQGLESNRLVKEIRKSIEEGTL